VKNDSIYRFLYKELHSMMFANALKTLVLWLKLKTPLFI